MQIIAKIKGAPWREITGALHEKGHAHAKQLLTPEQCSLLIGGYTDDSLYRRTVVMERYRFGSGEYRYYSDPLPTAIQAIRETAYAFLAPVANAWMRQLGEDRQFPPDQAAFRRQCAAHGQLHPAVLLLKYGPGGYNTLHQDIYGDLFFPIQMVLFLDEPGRDYDGGEFVLTEQAPRAQSRVAVLRPRQGDALFFATRIRPARGLRGYYRVHMKHGVSEVHRGNRHTLGIIFHDAAT